MYQTLFWMCDHGYDAPSTVIIMDCRGSETYDSWF